jgi:tight adherence protein B
VPLLASLVVALAVGVLGYAVVQSLMTIGRRYEEEYLSKAVKALDAIHATVDARVVWRASLCAVALGALLGFAASKQWVVAAMVGPLAGLIPLGYLHQVRKSRQQKFQDQLPDLVSQTRTAVACGYTLPMALGLAQRQLPAPASQELKLLQGHMKLGMPLTEALRRFQRRMPSPDLELVVGAISMAERSGGQLAAILANIEQSIREGLRLNRKLKTMTSRGRLEAWLIALAPAALGAGMYAIHPTMMSKFVAHPLGIPLLVASAIWMGIGFLVIRKILTPEF